MLKMKVKTHVNSVYGMVELEGYITENGCSRSADEPVMVITRVRGDYPDCFTQLLGAYKPSDVIESVLRPALSPNIRQTYAQPANFSPVHLTKPPASRAEMALARRVFIDSFSRHDGFRPGSETVAWIYGSAARQTFAHPTA